MPNGDSFRQLVALFLSEIIRSRKTSLRRAAEISRRVLSDLPRMVSEEATLKELTKIEREFEEVGQLKQALHFGYRPNDTKVFEQQIKDFASKAFVKDMAVSAAFLQDAAKPTMTVQELCLKYPEFCKFLEAAGQPVKGLPVFA